MNMGVCKGAFAALLLLSTSSCAGAGAYFTVNVDSLADSSASQAAYILIPGQETISIHDLQFREFANYVDWVLMSRGFRKASDVRDAEIAVLVSYGIGEPQTTAYTYSLPIYGVTGGGTSTFDASIVGLGGSSNISGTIHQPVTRGVVGSTIQTKTVTNFARFVVLDAIDLFAYRDSGEIVPVWKTTV